MGAPYTPMIPLSIVLATLAVAGWKETHAIALATERRPSESPSRWAGGKAGSE